MVGQDKLWKAQPSAWHEKGPQSSVTCFTKNIFHITEPGSETINSLFIKISRFNIQAVVSKTKKICVMNAENNKIICKQL